MPTGHDVETGDGHSVAKEVRGLIAAVTVAAKKLGLQTVHLMSEVVVACAEK